MRDHSHPATGIRLLLVAGLLTLPFGAASAAGAPSVQKEGPQRIAGRVVDDRGTPVAGARVVAVGAADAAATTSGPRGAFRLTLPPDVRRLRVSAAGFLDADVDLGAVADTGSLEIELTPLQGVRERVQVVGELAPPETPSTLDVDPDRVLRVAGSLDNVFRTLQVLPGVAAPEDFGSRLSVRGGGPDQNLTVMDGVEVHNPYRIFGLISAFNPETVERFELTAGGFSVRYGDRLSSLLVVDNRVGRPTFTGSAALSVTDGNVLLEGPLPGTSTGTWLLTGRRTYYDLVADSLTDSDFPSFGDIQARVDTGVGAGRLTLTGIRSREGADLSLDDEEEGERADALSDAANDLVAMSWTGPVGERGSSRTILSWYRNTDFLDFDGTFRNESRRSNRPDFEATGLIDVLFRRELEVRDAALRQELALPVGEHHLLDLGLELHALDTRVRFRTEGDRNLDEANGSSIRGGAGLPDELDSELEGLRIGAWVEDRVELGDRLSLTPGLRFDHSGLNDGTTLSPRLAARWRLGSRTTLRAAGGLFTQSPGYEKLVAADYFIDLQDAAARSIGHERAWHAILGVERSLGRGFELRAELWAKWFDELIVGRLETEAERRARLARYDFPASLQGSLPTEPIITSTASNGGAGRARGLDLFLVKSADGGRFQGWLAYTWSKAELDAYGRTLPFDYDRRHSVSAVGTVHLGSRFEFGFTGRWATGFPYTPVQRLVVAATEDVDDLDGDGDLEELVPERDGLGNLVYRADRGGVAALNTGRLPDYARLDLRLTWLPGGRGGRWAVYAEVLNALNRDNAAELEPRLLYDPDGIRPRVVEEPDGSLPLVPTIGVRYRF